MGFSSRSPTDPPFTLKKKQRACGRIAIYPIEEGSLVLSIYFPMMLRIFLKGSEGRKFEHVAAKGDLRLASHFEYLRFGHLRSVKSDILDFHTR